MPPAIKTIPIQRLNDIVTVLDHGITAKSIASSISSSAPESNRKVGEVRAFMKQSGFDRVAIAQSAHIIGYVDIEHLNDCKTGDPIGCLLYTSDAADDLLCVDLGGRRIIKKKKKKKNN